MTATQESTQHSQALNTARQAIYRFLSLAFLDPRTGSWTGLMEEELLNAVRLGSEFLRSEESLVAEELGRGELPLDQLISNEMFEKLPLTSEKLNQEYERTFGLVITGASPPYETEYIDGKLTFQRSHDLADIAGFYHAFGLTQNAEFPERDDHLVLELEFMASLIWLEQNANNETQNPIESAAICHDAQKNFLKDHLSWWVPTFVRGLSKEHPDGFYAATGKFLTAFLPAERALLGVKAPMKVVAPSALEIPEECDGCLSK